MEQYSQRKNLFSNNFQKTNLIIGGCVRTTHLDIFSAGGRKNRCNELIEILLLVTATVVGEFCYQHLSLLHFFFIYFFFLFLFLSFSLHHTIFHYGDCCPPTFPIPFHFQSMHIEQSTLILLYLRKNCLFNPTLGRTNHTTFGPLGQMTESVFLDGIRSQTAVNMKDFGTALQRGSHRKYINVIYTINHLNLFYLLIPLLYKSFIFIFFLSFKKE